MDRWLAFPRDLAGTLHRIPEWPGKTLAGHAQTVVRGRFGGVFALGQRRVSKTADRTVSARAVPGVPPHLELRRSLSVGQSAAGAIAGVCVGGPGGPGHRVVFFSVSREATVSWGRAAGLWFCAMGHLHRRLSVFSGFRPHDQFRLPDFDGAPTFHCCQHDHSGAGGGAGNQSAGIPTTAVIRIEDRIPPEAGHLNRGTLPELVRSGE